jgi:hypothetical protein
VSARKFSKEVVNSYYKGFKQPLNINNFVIRIGKPVAEEKPSEPLVSGIGVIN